MHREFVAINFALAIWIGSSINASKPIRVNQIMSLSRDRQSVAKQNRRRQVAKIHLMCKA